MSKRLFAIITLSIVTVASISYNLNVFVVSEAAAPTGQNLLYPSEVRIADKSILTEDLKDYSFFEQFIVVKESAFNNVLEYNEAESSRISLLIQEEKAEAERKRLEAERIALAAAAAEARRLEEERIRLEQERIAYEQEQARLAEERRRAEITAVTANVGTDVVKTRICEVFGDQCENALIIAKYESTFNPGAYYNGNYGLFQINCPSHSWRVGGNCNALFDLETNLRVAKDIYNQQGWGPWSTKIHL